MDLSFSMGVELRVIRYMIIPSFEGRCDRSQYAGSIGESSPTVPSSSRGPQPPVGRGTSRDRRSGSGDGPNQVYALAGCQDSEASPYVVLCTLSIFSYDVYALIDLGDTLSYVNPFVAKKFVVEPELLHESFAILTSVGESVIARRVYYECLVTICGYETLANLIELEMVDFDVIISMDWLSSSYATVDCRVKVARFHLPVELVLEWKGNAMMPRGRFISYLKAYNFIDKGCL
ncbi:hypothetical protein RDI58_004102 [Solanum bulbocastanum]|uniref:Gag-pol polyprotein n=1 Tax=Solanum bulbocastanum TaxID=147425 RepID=A0AAN8U567_SOLBU